MIEAILSGIALFSAVGVGAGVYYKLGVLTEKINFIYDHIDVCIKFSNNGGKK